MKENKERIEINNKIRTEYELSFPQNLEQYTEEHNIFAWFKDIIKESRGNY